MTTSLSRRTLVMAGAGLCTTPLLVACAARPQLAKPVSVGALSAGRVDDKGFMESGWRGLERARTELGAQTTFIDPSSPRKSCWWRH